MRLLRLVPIASVLFLMACEAPAPTGEASNLAQKAHALALERADGYASNGFGKALSACITWPRTAEGAPKVEYAHYTYTEIGTDGQVPTSQLRDSTLQACKGVAARYDLDCACQIVDINGKNVVQAAGAAARLSADALAAAEALDSQGYTISLKGSDVETSLARALSAYQRDWEMPVTGRLTPDLLDHIQRGHPDRAATWQEVDGADCTVYNPFPTARETIEWTGGCKDRRASGSGTLTFRFMRENAWHEQIFTGTLQAGEFHGPGKTTRTYGGSYEGMYRNGERHGQGIYRYANGNRYEGEWQEGKRSGQGKFRWANGSTYEGGWKDNGRHGAGTSRWPSGASYTGTWRDDKPNGKGTYVDPDGEVYADDWIGGCRQSKWHRWPVAGDGEECPPL